MNWIIKTIKIVLNTAMTIIIVFGILFVVLFLFGIQPYVVESGSMEPTIHTGSLCFIDKKANYDNMQVGDIIAFRINSSASATHRIISITENGFETKGDANSVMDNNITTKSNFIGKTLFSIPNFGFIVKGIQTARGKIILTTLIIALFLTGVLIGRKK